MLMNMSSPCCSTSLDEFSQICYDDDDKKFVLPIGFRFNPRDKELIISYLKNKIMGVPQPINIIREFNFYKFRPDQLPLDEFRYGKKNEVYYYMCKAWRNFYDATTADGHWEAICEDEIVDGDEVVGFKKVFLFCWRTELIETKGKWVMQEYRINPSSICFVSDGDSKDMMIAKMDRYVLCKIKEHSDCEDDIDNCEYCRELDYQDDYEEDN